MTNFHVIAGPKGVPEYPVIRHIGLDDITEALRQGVNDFVSQPSHLVFIGLIYPIVGFILAYWASNADLLPLLYPLMSGFALIGPFAAIGLYEISRRREAGLDTSWRHAFDVLRSPSLPAIIAVGVALLVIFVAWLTTAHALYTWLFQPQGAVTLQQFFNDILHTSRGHMLILIGNVVGFVFAAAAFCVSAVSFPLLLDRGVGAGVAVATSIRAVVDNIGPMIVWGLIITAGLAVGFITLFVGLAVIMPVLGHATWHLYRKLVQPVAA
ncbi:MAG: DUF2189 domain-containing protein [Methylobacteriaceae bacterium]|nr:DUF2189 domain-containing protein [Methylobacteriaceae bacterium]